MLTWNGPAECPGCGATVAVGIMSLAATCRMDGFYFVDSVEHRGWYSSQAAYERGDPKIAQPAKEPTGAGEAGK